MPRDRQSTIVVILLIAAGALALSRGAITQQGLVFLAVLVPSIILHEVSHGAAAYFFGDDTAKEAGRLTLNPIAHVDPFGTVILPAILILSHAPPFGFAKPVPVNPRRMRSPRNDGLLVSLAGPATNIVIAVAAAIAIRLFAADDLAAFRFGVSLPLGTEILLSFGFLNVVLAAFNLITLPPLDGSAIVERLLPAHLWPSYLRLRQYSMGLLLLLVFLLPGVLSTIFDHAIDLWAHLLR
jgi:Zn-dependent protease